MHSWVDYAWKSKTLTHNVWNPRKCPNSLMLLQGAKQLFLHNDEHFIGGDTDISNERYSSHSLEHKLLYEFVLSLSRKIYLWLKRIYAAKIKSTKRQICQGRKEERPGNLGLPLLPWWCCRSRQMISLRENTIYICLQQPVESHVRKGRMLTWISCLYIKCLTWKKV